jgi:hypothetical protein
LLNHGNYREVLADVLNAINALEANAASSAYLLEAGAGTHNCTTSGSTTVTIADNDTSGTTSPGDGFNGVSNDCNGGFGYIGTTMKGSLTGSFTSLSGSIGSASAYTAALGVNQVGLGVTYFDTNVISNSTPSTLTQTRSDADHATTTLRGGVMALTVTPFTGSANTSRTITLASAVRTLAPVNALVYPSFDGGFSIVGAIYASKSSSLAVSIDRTLAFRGSSPFNDGLITITAADGSKAQLEFYADSQGATQRQTKLDADGDGTYEVVEAGYTSSFRP